MLKNEWFLNNLGVVNNPLCLNHITAQESNLSLMLISLRLCLFIFVCVYISLLLMICGVIGMQVYSEPIGHRGQTTMDFEPSEGGCKSVDLSPHDFPGV